MNSNKLIPILGLLIVLILAIGSVSAAETDMDSNSVDNDMDDIDSSESVEVISDVDDAICDEEQDSSDAKDSLQSSNVGSTYQFTQNDYNTYFNSTNGHIISGKLNSGDTLDFSGSFSGKNFTIDLPLILTSTDRTAKFTNCAFNFIPGSDGSTISNLDAKQVSNPHSPVISVSSANNLTFINNTIFSNQTKSFPMSFSNVSGLKIFNNSLRVNSFDDKASQPSLMVFFGGSNCNVSDNTLIMNDSNGIYFSTFGASGASGENAEGSMFSNYIFNNTIYSVRALPSSFGIPIQVMGRDNIILNNTIHDAYQGISCTSSGNQIIGNKIYNVHGAYYSYETTEKGGGYPIYVGKGCIISDNIIFDSNLSDSSAAIGAGENSLVSGNLVYNVNGIGVSFTGNNISFTNNNLNVTGYGAYLTGNSSDITIEQNIIDSGNNNSVRIQKQSRTVFPHDIIIQNNTFYTTAETAFNVDSVCTNIVLNNNIINGSSDIPDEGDGNTTHYINDINFYNYFDITGVLNDKIKENDTIIFVGSFSSKGRLYINNKVNITGMDAVFTDTTFIIEDNDVIIQNITISNPNDGAGDRLWGIQINNVSNVTIQNCNISIFDPFSAFAIYVLDSSNCSIIDNYLEARGDYFTSAFLSFNSRDLYIAGNSLKTIGTGEVYLVNNKSCLDGYLNYYAACLDGSFVCPDGYEICPDGSIVCPDGTQINAEDYRICVDGSIVCTDGHIICPDGSVICFDGSQICPDGSVCVDGTTYCIDGSIICPDGSTICPDGTTICPDGSVICTDGTQICADGSIVCPDGTVYGPGEYYIDDDGNYVCPDGTVVCPDGSGSTSGSSSILDGVVPGSHMVSGLYRTYGFLMVHSSNVTFEKNTVNVSSALPADYNLNESANTIAGVFVHYGGFDNLIVNNTIVLDSNDPILYGIGIVGAPANSTAVGSANNTFTYNNISIKGAYLTVGILLGNKAIDSDIEYNKFNITSGKPSPNVVNYNTSANNIVENNEFGITLGSEFSFDNVVVTVQEANEGTVLFKVVLQDKVGNPLAEKSVSFTFNGQVTNCTTDGNGTATFECNVKELGTYVVEMDFKGDDDYIASSASGTITVRRSNTSLTVSNVSYKTTDATKTITATLKDENGAALAGKTIKFVVNGVTYTGTTDANGIASVKVNLNAGGTYVVSASFTEDDGYAASSGSGKLTLNKVATSLTSAGKTYTVTNTAKYIYVTLKDASGKLISGKKITATVNGKTFSASTDSKGQAKIKLTLSAVKTFTVSLKFAGDNTYSASTKSIKVKVTKTKTKLAVPTKTFKKAAKTKKVTATLKDSTGKAVKSKTVKFTVNGKTYSAKTNNKGIATVKVKLTKKGTFKVKVKFAGDGKYLAVTKTGTLKIK